MHLLRIGGLAVIVCALVGSSTHRARRATPNSAAKVWESASAPEALRMARAEWKEHHLEASLAQYESGYRTSIGASNKRDAARFLIGAGGCEVGLFAYAKAAERFREARQLALSIDDQGTVGLAGFNLGSLYLAMNDEPNAAASFEAGLEAVHQLDGSPNAAQMSGLLGMLYARRGDRAAATAALRKGVLLAREQGDRSVEASAWDHLGNELTHEGDLPAAEHALLEGFRLRKFWDKRNVFLSYCTLADLKLRQGDLRTARSLVEGALLESLIERRSIPLYVIYHQRGQIRAAQGDVSGALGDFRKSLALAKAWRLEVIPSDSTRTGTDVSLREIYASFVQTGNRLYFEARPGPKREILALETLTAQEENRAASLREKLAEAENLQKRLPPDYWGKLAELREADTHRLQSDAHASHRKTDRLRFELTEMESQWNVPVFGTSRTAENYLSQNSLISFHKVISSQEVFLSFHLGAGESYLWAATRDRLRLYRLAGRKELAGLALEFADAVRDGSADRDARGRALYAALFSGLAPEIFEKPNWLMALEDVLFEAPFAAMPINGKEGSPQYFVERHSIQIVPTFGLLARQTNRPAGPFVGVGDPVYNTADSRWQGPAVLPKPGMFTLQAGGGAEVPQFGRLVSSGVEVSACAKAARFSEVAPVLLTGRHATFDNIRRMAGAKPSVIHIATHVVDYGDGQPRIALTLRPYGPELISARDIAMLRIPGCQVVMSGCSSGAGEVLPGAGLLGLSRAWLAAGASGVVASHWQTPDDTGELFLSFYRRLGDLGRRRSTGGAAEALREAQVEMLRSASWRSGQRYWAAFFAIGGTR